MWCRVVKGAEVPIDWLNAKSSSFVTVFGRVFGNMRVTGKKEDKMRKEQPFCK